MLRISVCLAVVLLAAANVHPVSAETAAPPTAKPSKIKLTVEHLKEMRARWLQNRPKLIACRKEMKAKGLAGDDRWFFMEDCMTKTRGRLPKAGSYMTGER
jgi:hypothetical protein